MADRKLLKYKDGTEVLVPISKITSGNFINVVRDVDASGDPLDSVTINSTHKEFIIEGTDREINVFKDLASDVYTIRLEENLKLRDGKLTFGGVVTTIDASVDDGCLFLHEVTV